MKYRLKRKESVGEGLHRILHQEFEAVSVHLHSLSKEEGRHEAIHETRRHLKRMRALCQIWRAPIGIELCSREATVLRDLARNLSAVRDMEVRLALLGDLLRNVTAAKAPVLQRIKKGWTLELQRQLGATCHPAAVARLIRTLTTARQRFSAFPLKGVGWPVIANALARSHRRARKAFAVAKKKAPPSDALHEWRKRTKALEYQLMLLERTHSRVDVMGKTLKELTDCLGYEHDLAVLEGVLLKSHSAYVKSLPGIRLLAAITKRRRRLLRRAQTLGREVFSTKTQKFSESMKRWWHRWKK